MLGKLLKHEWKGTYRVGCLMLILMVAVTFLGWLSFQSPMWNSLANDTEYYSTNIAESLLNIMSVFTLLLYIFMLLAAVIGIVVYLAVHFYKTMYTDEGYLTHTLPVTVNKLLFSKIFISGVWMMIIILAVYASLFALVCFMIGAILPDGYSVWEFWRVFGIEFSDLAELLRAEFGFDFVGWLKNFIVPLIIGPFLSMITLFGAISLGQLFTKHRVLMAIVSYFGVSIVSGILGSAVEGIITASHAYSNSVEVVGSYLNVTFFSSLILDIVIAAAMFFAAWYVNTKKLNLE